MPRRSKSQTTYYAGFCDGKIDYGWTIGGRSEIIPIMSIFKTRKAARIAFKDVRKVKITEIK